MFLVPVYAALLAWPLLGEAPQLFHAYGFVMILLGVRLASLRGAAGRQPPPPRPDPPATRSAAAALAAMTSCITWRGASA